MNWRQIGGSNAIARQRAMAGDVMAATKKCAAVASVLLAGARD